VNSARVQSSIQYYSNRRVVCADCDIDTVAMTAMIDREQADTVGLTTIQVFHRSLNHQQADYRVDQGIHNEVMKSGTSIPLVSLSMAVSVSTGPVIGT
jgi:hypothetical protein